MTITADSITADETIPVRSRTYSPEVVQKVSDLLNGDPGTPGDDKADPPVPAREKRDPVKNVAVGIFDKEGAARSALVTLNRLLAAEGHDHTYAGTVREQSDGTFKAILINKPAKKVERKAKPVKGNGTQAQKPAAPTPVQKPAAPAQK